MDELFAYYVRTVKDNQPFDHTYVASSVGDLWPCPDGCTCTGGILLAKGYGDRNVADCLSYDKHTPVRPSPPIGSRYADLEYGIDGVCHQMSNRILYATNNSLNPQPIDVIKARLAPVTYFLFGKYGLGKSDADWQRLHFCTNSLFYGGGGNPSGDDRMDDSDRFDISSQISGFRQRFDVQLGADHKDRESVMMLAEHTFRAQSELRESLREGHISREVYLHEINLHISRMMEEMSSMLGSDGYRRLFGDVTPGEAAAAINPEIFLGESQKLRAVAQ